MISHSFAPISCSFHISLPPSFWDDSITFCACLVVLWKPGPPWRCLKKAMAIGGAQLVRLRPLDKMWSTLAQLPNRARCREGQGDVLWCQSPWVDVMGSSYPPTHPPTTLVRERVPFPPLPYGYSRISPRMCGAGAQTSVRLCPVNIRLPRPTRGARKLRDTRRSEHSLLPPFSAPLPPGWHHSKERRSSDLRAHRLLLRRSADQSNVVDGVGRGRCLGLMS